MYKILRIQFLTRGIRGKKQRGQIPREIVHERVQFIANQLGNEHNWGMEGKLASRNSRPSQLPRTITFPYALVPRIVSHVEPCNKVVENGACVRTPFNLTWSYVLVPVPVNHHGMPGNDQGGAGRGRERERERERMSQLLPATQL